MKKRFTKFILFQLIIIFIFSLCSCSNDKTIQIDSVDELKEGSYIIGTP